MKVKSRQDIARMREAGLLLWETHGVARDMVKAGVTTGEINAAVEAFLEKKGAKALFKGVPGPVPYPAATCISVNEEIVHGIPGKRVLKDGDIVSIDIGLRLDGWCSDCACTWPVGRISPEKSELLAVTEECLRIAIRELKPGVKWSSIAAKMEAHAHSFGFSVVEELVGHGIGREMWESPQIPNYVTRTLPDFVIREGMVIAVEPMINAGTRKIEFLEDQWTVATRDGRPSAHFEHSIAVTADGAQVLTCGPEGEGWASV